jgi:LysR family transcriptional regulator, hydrogen peroxide-inducible genes activator
MEYIYIMNLSQLEYIVAIDNHRHFVTAAEKCFVTQATLSMMIKKLEAELGLKIFDRSKHPVEPTPEGLEVIQRARVILAEVHRLKSYAAELEGNISGELHLGVIPTLAPYLLPLFLKSFSKKYPDIKLFIKELVTRDIGLLATPLKEAQLNEHPLFYEEFFVYASGNEKLPKKRYLLPRELDPSHLWLLEEGHCLRNQVINLCELKTMDAGSDKLHYEAGSIETLINMVDKNDGITIVPYLATLLLNPSQNKNLREFSKPKPSREISLVTAASFPRIKLLSHLKAEIIASVPATLLDPEKKQVTEI